jgi:hypothetical protein
MAAKTRATTSDDGQDGGTSSFGSTSTAGGAGAVTPPDDDPGAPVTPPDEAGDPPVAVEVDDDQDDAADADLATEGEDAAPGHTRRPRPAAPSFGMAEGTREELERTGEATDPFTGRRLTRDDL